MYLRIPREASQINGLGACKISDPVIVRHIHCTPADLAAINGVPGRTTHMEVADVRAYITAAVHEAVRLLRAAAAPLFPRPGEGTKERDRLEYFFQEAFGVMSHEFPKWRPAGQTWDRGGVVRERLRCAARILSNGSIHYHAWGPRSCPDLTWTAATHAIVRGGQLRMCFGQAFWTPSNSGEIASTILHEALHIYFAGLVTEHGNPGRFGTAACFERFVMRMNGLPLSDYMQRNCVIGLPRGDFPLPPRDRVFAGLSSADHRSRFNYRKWMPHRRRPLGLSGLGACATGAAAISSHSLILDTIKCELSRKFTSSTDPKLFLRRLRLRELFNAVDATEAENLAANLRNPADPLGKLLKHNVSSVTRNELLTILFLADYDLNFQPGTDISPSGIPVLGVDSNPRMTAAQKTKRTTDVNDTVSELLTRRDDRATKALAGTVPAATSAPAVLMPSITRLSTAQLAMFSQYYPGTGGIKLDDYGRGFEQFANGELRDLRFTKKRGPNGEFFFLFAEFGFLCVDSGVDVAHWTRLLRIWVAGVEIFMHVFRPAPHKLPPVVGAPLPSTGAAVRTLADFLDTNFDKKGQSKEPRKAALRKKYAGMNVAALKKAAAENMLRALRMT